MATKTDEHRIERVPLSKLKEAPRNPKLHSEKIGGSISRFGYVEPIVLDERTGRIVAGHGRREALLKLKASGAKPPAGVVARGREWLVPVMRGWASKNDAEAEAYLIASNRLVEVGGWDESELAQMLGAMLKSDVLEGVGFSEAEINDLLATQSDTHPIEKSDLSLPSRWQLVLDLSSEQQLNEMLARLSAEGFKCRALIM